MKKNLLVASLLMASATVNISAQYAPEKGDFSLEAGFTPFKNTGEMLKLNDASFKGRYFISDYDALRLRFGIGVGSDTDIQYNTNPDGTDTDETKTILRETDFNLGFGYERHFSPINRLDLYAGAELFYGQSHYKKKVIENSHNAYGASNFTDSEIVTTYKKNNGNNVIDAWTLGVNLLAGADFYITKGLYVGAEMGVNIQNTHTPDTYYIRESTTTTNSTTTVVKYDSSTGVTQTIVNGSATTPQEGNVQENSRNNFRMKCYINPEIRIGVCF